LSYRRPPPDGSDDQMTIADAPHDPEIR